MIKAELRSYYELLQDTLNLVLMGKLWVVCTPSEYVWHSTNPSEFGNAIISYSKKIYCIHINKYIMCTIQWVSYSGSYNPGVKRRMLHKDKSIRMTHCCDWALSFNIFFYEKLCISISLNFVYKGLTYNKSTLVHIMFLCQTGSNLLPEPMFTEMSDNTRSQWVLQYDPWKVHTFCMVLFCCVSISLISYYWISVINLPIFYITEVSLHVKHERVCVDRGRPVWHLQSMCT